MAEETSQLRDEPNANPLRLRLYIAGSTPNSARARQNLLAALAEIGQPNFQGLEIINVLAHPRRAIVDGVIVTPTLIGLKSAERVLMMGDLTDSAQLRSLLADIADGAPDDES